MAKKKRKTTKVKTTKAPPATLFDEGGAGGDLGDLLGEGGGEGGPKGFKPKTQTYSPRDYVILADGTLGRVKSTTANKVRVTTLDGVQTFDPDEIEFAGKTSEEALANREALAARRDLVKTESAELGLTKAKTAYELSLEDRAEAKRLAAIKETRGDAAYQRALEEYAEKRRLSSKAEARADIGFEQGLEDRATRLRRGATREAREEITFQHSLEDRLEGKERAAARDLERALTRDERKFDKLRTETLEERRASIAQRNQRFTTGTHVQLKADGKQASSQRPWIVESLDENAEMATIRRAGTKGSRTRVVPVSRLNPVSDATASGYLEEAGAAVSKARDYVGPSKEFAPWSVKLSKMGFRPDTPEKLIQAFEESGLMSGAAPKSFAKPLGKLAARIASLGEEASTPAFLESLVARIQSITGQDAGKAPKAISRVARELEGGLKGGAAKALTDSQGVFSKISSFARRRPLAAAGAGLVGWELLSNLGDLGGMAARSVGLESPEDIERRVSPVTAQSLMRRQQTQQLEARNLAAYLGQQGASASALSSILEGSSAPPYGSMVLAGQ